MGQKEIRAGMEYGDIPIVHFAILNFSSMNRTSLTLGNYISSFFSWWISVATGLPLSFLQRIHTSITNIQPKKCDGRSISFSKMHI